MSTAPTNVAVLGVGWADTLACGSVLRSARVAASLPLPSSGNEPGVFTYPVKSFARFDAVSRMACVACALALRDAGLRYGEGGKLDIGLLGTNARAALEANRSYFQDYVHAGRKLGRGSLFIYTLPSSPLAEAAIHFGLQGPVLYLGAAGPALATVVRTAAAMVRRGEAAGMLAVRAEADEAFCVALSTAEAAPGRRVWAVDDLARRAAGGGRARDLAAALAAADGSDAT